MKTLRVLVLTHEDLIPPETMTGYSMKEILEWKAQYDVVAGLRDLEHDVRILGLSTDLGVLRDTILEWKPHISFNLLEEFHGVSVYGAHVVSFLELMRQRYTGCNPRGLLLAYDKALSKKILSYHRIRIPRFAVFPRRKAVRRPPELRFPMLVKSMTEEGSYGLAQASIVSNEEKLRERVEYLHGQLNTDAIAEEYIEGRELYVAIIGNRRLRTLPVLELDFGTMPEGAHLIATDRVKWNHEYQKKHGIKITLPRNLAPELVKKLERTGKRIYRILSLSGYARIDFRLKPDGELYVLEANPNPDISYGEEMSQGAAAIGMSYEDLIQRILTLGLNYQAEWRKV